MWGDFSDLGRKPEEARFARGAASAVSRRSSREPGFVVRGGRCVRALPPWVTMSPRVSPLRRAYARSARLLILDEEQIYRFFSHLAKRQYFDVEV